MMNDSDAWNYYDDASYDDQRIFPFVSFLQPIIKPLLEMKN